MAGNRVDLAGVESCEIQAMVDRATSGDRIAAALLIDGLAPVLRRRIARVLARRAWRARGRAMRDDLDDLVQDAFAGLFHDRGRALRSWNPGRGLGFVGFVGLLAEREAGMAMRTRKRNPWTEEPMPDDSLSNLRGATANLAVRLEARDQLRQLFERARARLTGSGRRYFEWLVVEGRSIQAVADDTGASAEALYAWRTRLTRLLREIRAELAATEPPKLRACAARRTGAPRRFSS